MDGERQRHDEVLLHPHPSVRTSPDAGVSSGQLTPAGRRPNTVPPSPDRLIVLDSNTMNEMSDSQLIEMADEMFGLVIPAGTKRSAIESKIVSAAQYAYDN